MKREVVAYVLWVEEVAHLLVVFVVWSCKLSLDFVGLVELLLDLHGFPELLDEISEFGFLRPSGVHASERSKLLDHFAQGVGV